jgi:hypothetical protein
MSQTISRDQTQANPPAEKRRAVEPRAVRLRGVALPVEHGGWGLTLEPIALGLLIAPSAPGFFLAVATLGGFLARHPLKLVMNDLRRGRQFARMRVAGFFAAGYGMIAAAGLLAAMMTAVDYGFLLPLAAAMPLAALQLIYDGTGRSRALFPEMAGSLAMGAVAASIALAAGFPFPASLALWALLAARAAPTILYVRARLRILHRSTSPTTPVILAHTLALILSLLLTSLKVAPLLAALAFLALLWRAVMGFSARKTAMSAKQIGLRELCFGALTVLTIALGYRLGW